MDATRTETDSFGPIEVPLHALWGAQTARSLQFFAIGDQTMPIEVVHAMAWVKWAGALANRDLQQLDAGVADAIASAAQRVASGEFDGEFPLSVWQTGSGTQSHINVNEVLAHLATLTLAGPAGNGGAARVVHPNDDVNRGQSSNDVFPSAVHIAVALQAKHRLLPAMRALRIALLVKARAFASVVKVGRTHLQDATPVTLGQEFGGYEAQISLCHMTLRHAQVGLHSLAIGGTAVGTGLNTHAQFGARVAAMLAHRLELPLVQADNLFAAMAGQEAMVAFHAGLRMLAIALTKIANDVRLMGSGPRAGIGELRLPQNEPGSSIMPGKVNPTQVEALTMVCAQVMGHDAAIGFAASQGQLELNVYKPLIALDTLDSLRLLSDAMLSFAQHCVSGIEVDTARVAQMLHGSLMLVTALAPHIGYDRAAQVAKYADEHGSTLREAALKLDAVTADEFDAWVDARRMLGPATPLNSPRQRANHVR